MVREDLQGGRVFVSEIFEVPSASTESIAPIIYAEAFEKHVRARYSISAEVGLLNSGPRRVIHSGQDVYAENWGCVIEVMEVRRRDRLINRSKLASMHWGATKESAEVAWNPGAGVLKESKEYKLREDAEVKSQPAGYEGYLYCEARSHDDRGRWIEGKSPMFSEVMPIPKLDNGFPNYSFHSFVAKQFGAAYPKHQISCAAWSRYLDEIRRRQAWESAFWEWKMLGNHAHDRDITRKRNPMVRSGWILDDAGYRAFGAIPIANASPKTPPGSIRVDSTDEKKRAAEQLAREQRERDNATAQAAAKAKQAKQAKEDAELREKVIAETKLRKKKEAFLNVELARRKRDCLAGSKSACLPQGPIGVTKQ